MIIYSVTVSINKGVESDWLHWMKEVHIPDVMATGLFSESHFNKLLYPPPHDDNSATYNIQYHCASLADYERYQEEFAPRLQQEHTARYEQQFVAFRTILESV